MSVWLWVAIIVPVMVLFGWIVWASCEVDAKDGLIALGLCAVFGTIIVIGIAKINNNANKDALMAHRGLHALVHDERVFALSHGHFGDLADMQVADGWVAANVSPTGNPVSAVVLMGARGQSVSITTNDRSGHTETYPGVATLSLEGHRVSATIVNEPASN